MITGSPPGPRARGCLGLLRRPWLLPLVVAALAVRLIVAPGAMPVAAADGLTITICTGAGLIHAPLADPGHAPAKPCPYDALGAPALGAAPPAWRPPAIVVFPLARVVFSPAPFRPTAPAPVPPARGPPAGAVAPQPAIA